MFSSTIIIFIFTSTSFPWQKQNYSSLLGCDTHLVSLFSPMRSLKKFLKWKKVADMNSISSNNILSSVCEMCLWLKTSNKSSASGERSTSGVTVSLTFLTDPCEEDEEDSLSCHDVAYLPALRSEPNAARVDTLAWFISLKVTKEERCAYLWSERSWKLAFLSADWSESGVSEDLLLLLLSLRKPNPWRPRKLHKYLVNQKKRLVNLWHWGVFFFFLRSQDLLRFLGLDEWKCVKSAQTGRTHADTKSWKDFKESWTGDKDVKQGCDSVGLVWSCGCSLLWGFNF